MSALAEFRAVNVAGAMVEVWPEFSAKHDLIPNACIMATALALETFTYYGVRADPAPVSVIVYNAQLVSQLEAGQDVDYEAGAWSVGVDPTATPSGPRRWPGHLVAVTEVPTLLLDLTLGQMSRPGKGIVLAPWAVEATGIWGGVDLSYLTDGGCHVHYRHRPETADWTHAPDWARSKENRRLAGDFIRMVKPKIVPVVGRR